MDKRYQIFISSTFADLEEERKAIMEAILSLDCFPTGMEMFPASDSEQFEYIKSIIDECDYYILIIAGRYGSEDEDGKSYTQKEFEYARDKGIPVLVFAKKDIDNIPVNKTDGDEKKKKKLSKFREVVMQNRLAKYWDDCKDLKYEVHDSLSKIFKINPRIGWVRGNIANNEQLLQQLNDTRKECDELKEILKAKEIQEKNNKRNYSIEEFENEEIDIYYYIENNNNLMMKEVFSWRRVFSIIARVMYEKNGASVIDIKQSLGELISKTILDDVSIEIDEEGYFRAIARMLRDNLCLRQQNYYYLTEDGKLLLFELASI